MSAVLELKIALTSTTCPACGVEYAMPSHLLAEKRRNKGTVYCPNGHTGSWSETEEDRLRKQVERLEREKKWAEERANANAADAERTRNRLIATKGALTKAKKSVGNGVCPCCNRTFKSLAAHMKTKHPDYADAPVEDAE